MSYTPPIGDATNARKGIVQLTGDLAGTAAVPLVANGVISSAKLADGSVTEAKIAIVNSPATSQVLSWNGSAMAWAAPATGGTSTVNVPIFNVAEAPYNADNTGATNAQPAIQQAIDDAGAAGGGMVYIPHGDYLINFTANVAGLGVAGGLQLYTNVWLKGEGSGTRLVAGGTWTEVAGVVGIGSQAVSRGDTGTQIYNTRISDIFIKSVVGKTSSGGTKANCVAILYNTYNGTTVIEPDAAHRIHDILIWDTWAGMLFMGTDDQGMMVQRVRGRRFTAYGVRIVSADNYFAFLDFSSANRGGGTNAVFEVASTNCHYVSCKAWYAKRMTAFSSSATYSDGAGWYIAGGRNAFIGCEAQDNGGHGFLIYYGKNTFTGCIADSNSYYDTVTAPAAVNECSGFYVAGNLTSLEGIQSFSRSTSHRDQKYGVYIASTAAPIVVTGTAYDNCETVGSTNPLDGVKWAGTPNAMQKVTVGVAFGSTINMITN